MAAYVSFKSTCVMYFIVYFEVFNEMIIINSLSHDISVLHNKTYSRTGSTFIVYFLPDKLFNLINLCRSISQQKN